MKKTNKLFSVILALALVFAMAIPAFAANDGKITVNNAVVDQTYSIYKIFSFAPTADTTDEKGLYTVADPWTAFVNGDGADYVKVQNGTIEWVWEAAEGETTTEDEAKAAFAKAALAYAEANKIEATKSAKAEATTVEFTELEYGYYLVDSSLGALCALTTTNTEATVTEKNAETTLTKEVQEDRDNEWYENNDATIGQTVNFRATITVGKGAENYVLHDKMEAGLTYTGVTQITLNGTEIDASNYAVTAATADAPLDDGCTFEVDFTPAFEATLAENDVIVVEYTAELNEKATVGIVDGNENEAWLTYGDDNTTTHDKTTTYTYKLIVDKVDGENQPLTGAGFTLTDADGKTYAPVVSEDGTQFTWTGLDEGEYTLEETTVPAGYNKADDITFTVTAGDDAAGDSLSADNGVSYVADDDALETTVVNKTGSLLPETGGIGTTIFYIVGALLVVGAVVILVSKKRTSAEA